METPEKKTPEAPRPALSPEPEPLRWHFPPLGRRVCCALFLVLLAGMALSHQVPIAGLPFALLLSGGLPAVLLMIPGTSADRLTNALAVLAVVALFGVFLLYNVMAWDVARTDAQGGLIFLFGAPVSHGLWFLFAAPYFFRLMMNASPKP